MEWQTTYTPGRRCPTCGGIIDGMTGVSVPEPDDLTICAHCLAILVFDPAATHGVRPLRAEELAEIKNEAPELYVNIVRMRDVAVAVQIEKRRAHIYKE